MSAFEPTNASFDAGAPIPSTAEPALPLVRQSCGRFSPCSRQHHLLDAALLGGPLISRSSQFAIAVDQLRRMAKLLAVLVHAGVKLGRIVGIALEYARLGNDATLGL